MGIREQFSDILGAAHSRVCASSLSRLNDFAKRGMLQSGPAVLSYAQAYMKAVEEELLKALDMIGQARPTRDEWEQIRRSGRKFVDDQHAYMVEDCRRKWGGDSGLKDIVDHVIEEPRVDAVKSEIYAELDAFVDGRKRSISERWKALMWEVAKGIICAVLGALVAHYLDW